jgi:glycosyltransferase involved in cell wall biosynthesis
VLQTSTKLVLIGNYPNDEQESMRRFGELLARRLPYYGIEVEYLCPRPVFGRFHRGMRGAGKWLGYADKFLLFPPRLKKRIRQFDSSSIAHICDHSNAVYSRILANVPHLVTCHDLLAVRAARGEIPCHKVRASGRFYQKFILRGLELSRRVACVSRASYRDLLRLSKLNPGQVTVVYNGLNYNYAPVADLAERWREFMGRLGNEIEGKLRKEFILHVGGNQWYKNRLGVLQIYARVCEKIPNPPNLVMAGKPFTSELREFIISSRLDQRVVELTALSNEDLRLLYCKAQALLFPSLEEGFGWPIIEAQACGCPVVIANREPMSEVGGDAAVRFEMPGFAGRGDTSFAARAADQGAEAVVAAVQEKPEERLNRVRMGLENAAQFSTDRMIESYVSLYSEILEEVSLRHLRPSEAGLVC